MKRLSATLAAGAGAVLLALAATVSPTSAGATDQLVGDTTDTLSPEWLGDVPGFGEIAPEPDPGSGVIALSNCTITNPLFKEDDPSRIRALVPQHYELGTNPYFGPMAATIMVAVLDCSPTAGGGDATATRPSIAEQGVVLTMVAVQVVADATGDAAWDAYNQSPANFLPSSSWYLLAVDTDNAALAHRLRAAGLQPFHVENLAHHADYAGDAKFDSVTVPLSAQHGYQMATTTRFGDPFVHDHDWFFWTDGPRGKAGFLLHLDAMEDTSCGYNLSAVFELAGDAAGPCGTTVAAEPGSRIAHLLGFADASSRETPYSFHHPAPKAGHIELIPAPSSTAG